jgi:hypothetical protein
MTDVLFRYDPAAERRHKERARDTLPSRFAAFGADYQTIVLDTCARR